MSLVTFLLSFLAQLDELHIAASQQKNEIPGSVLQQKRSIRVQAEVF
jgi:hypothetical protein